MASEQSLLKNGAFLPLIGTFQSCQLSCRIRNLTLQQSVFRFQAVQMTGLQGGISSMQESIAKLVKMPMSGGSRPNKTPQSARPACWEDVREGDGKSCSLWISTREMLCTTPYVCATVAWLYPSPPYRLIFHTPLSSHRASTPSHPPVRLQKSPFYLIFTPKCITSDIA